jgi:hypothetical protein
MFQTKIAAGKIKTLILFSASPPQKKSCRFLDNVGKKQQSQAGHRRQYNTTHEKDSICISENQNKNKDTHTLVFLFHGINGYANAP